MWDLDQIGTGGISGAMGILLGYLGFRSKIASIEKNVGTKVDEKTFTAVKEGIHQRIDDLKGNIDTRFDTLELLVKGKK
jgi:hypothetical protein